MSGHWRMNGSAISKSKTTPGLQQAIFITTIRTMTFLQEHNITTLVQLQETVSEMKKRYRNTNGKIKQTEKLIHERKELIDQSENYLP